MNSIKISALIAQRPELLRQVRLANLAYAYQTLVSYTQRVAQAHLQGRVVLRPINPDEERFCVTLTALEGNQSVIEEHFSDEDLVLLADVLGFATGHPAHELTFYIEQLDEFVTPLRIDLEHAGVTLDNDSSPVEQPRESP
jgi:class 3 adenylate cyclase